MSANMSAATPFWARVSALLSQWYEPADAAKLLQALERAHGGYVDSLALAPEAADALARSMVSDSAAAASVQVEQQQAEWRRQDDMS